VITKVHLEAGWTVYIHIEPEGRRDGGHVITKVHLEAGWTVYIHIEPEGRALDFQESRSSS